MILGDIVNYVLTKEKFQSIEDYLDFCKMYLEFAKNGLQAKIISQNESHYQFYQYKEDGHFNITRPINSKLWCDEENFISESQRFLEMFYQLKNEDVPPDSCRMTLRRVIYTTQQSIGAALDALPAGKSNSVPTDFRYTCLAYKDVLDEIQKETAKVMPVIKIYEKDLL